MTSNEKFKIKTQIKREKQTDIQIFSLFRFPNDTSLFYPTLPALLFEDKCCDFE
jgi:hypothetical protein